MTFPDLFSSAKSRYLQLVPCFFIYNITAASVILLLKSVPVIYIFLKSPVLHKIEKIFRTNITCYDNCKR